MLMLSELVIPLMLLIFFHPLLCSGQQDILFVANPQLLQMILSKVRKMPDADNDQVKNGLAIENNLVEISNDKANVFASNNFKEMLMQPPQPQMLLNIKYLIHSFQLSSMKPLLYQISDSDLNNRRESLERLILSTSRWSRVKDGRLYVLLQNQMVPIDSLITALNNPNDLTPLPMPRKAADFNKFGSMARFSPNFQNLPSQSKLFRLATLNNVGYNNL